MSDFWLRLLILFIMVLPGYILIALGGLFKSKMEDTDFQRRSDVVWPVLFMFSMLGCTAAVSAVLNSQLRDGMGFFFGFCWLGCFVFVGFVAHSLFYWCEFPLSFSFKGKAIILGYFAKILWWLQAPFAGFSTARLWDSLVWTQLAIFVLSLAGAVWCWMADRRYDKPDAKS